MDETLFGYRVTNVTKTGDSLDRIERLSGPGWGPYPVAEVVSLMRLRNRFYTSGPGGEVDLTIVEVSPPHVRTKPTATLADNLLSLPPCPLR